MKNLCGTLGILSAVILSLACFTPTAPAQQTAALREALTTKLELQVVELSEKEAELIPEGLRKLPLFAPDTLPRGGTFYSLQLNPYPPLPANTLALPCWSLGDGMFLMNDVTVDYVALREEGIAKLKAEKAERAKLKASAKGQTALVLDEEESESGGMMLRVFAADELGLDLETKTNTTGYFSIHIPNTETNGSYDLYMTTNLSADVPGLNLTNWLWLLRTTVGQTNLSVPNLTDDIAFFRLGTLLDTDSDGLTDAFENLVSHTLANNADQNTNGILDGWEWKYFGNLNQSGTNDYDGDGVSNFAEYTNGYDPNKIVFTVAVTNNYVSTSYPSVQLNVSNGVPSYYTVLRDSTNFSSATWLPYTGNPTVNLGATEGWHEVWIGLRGLPSDARQSWQWKRLKLDTTPARLTITSPTNTTVMQPIVQLLGYSPEALLNISYDLTNAAGRITNQQVLILNQHFNQTTWEFTTNTFQAFDVSLTNGVNTFTLRATDLAGNTTTTNFTFTLDYSGKTNPPTVQLLWPTNGMTLCGDSFILSGWVSDPTASVTVQTVNTNGTTNVFNGAVGRDGKFWVQDLPLHTGTNAVTLIVTDVATNSFTTNFTLIQGNIGLSVNPITANQTTVTGTINSTNYSVWVNGMLANINGTNWTATNVALPPNASLVQVMAVPSAGSSLCQWTSGMADNAGIFLECYHDRFHDHYNLYTNGVLAGTKDQSFWMDWANGSGGTNSTHWLYTGNLWPLWWPPEFYEDSITNIWPATTWPQPPPVANGIPLVADNGYGVSIAGQGVARSLVSCATTFKRDYPNPYLAADELYTERGQAGLSLATGGKPGSTNVHLWQVSADATEWKLVPAELLWQDQPPGAVALRDIPSTNIIAGAFGRLDDQGHAYMLLPDNATVDITPYVAGVDYYTFNDPPEKFKLQIMFNGSDVTDSNVTAIVGQKIGLTTALVGSSGSTPLTLSNFLWTVPGTTFSNYVANDFSGMLHTNFSKTNSEVNFYWVDGGSKSVSCKVVVAGQALTAQTTFNVIRPEITWTLTPHDTVAVDTNYFPGFGIHDYWLRTGKGETTNNCGMQFSFQVVDMKGFNGFYSLHFCQLGSLDWKRNMSSGTFQWGESVSGSGVDTIYPVPWRAIVLNSSGKVVSGYTDDTPASALYAPMTFNWRTDRFETYLLFTPDGGQPVPLKLATWSWHGTAKRSGTNEPAIFISGGNSTNQQAATGVDCFTHPIWTNNCTYIKTNWQLHINPFPTP